MRNLLHVVVALAAMTGFLSLFGLSGCGTKPAHRMEAYNKMYADSFETVLAQCTQITGFTHLTIVDTLYTEMYIALKSCTENDTDALHLVFQKVDSLMELDSITGRKLKCLEAKGIAFGFRKDIKGFLANEYQKYLLYPDSSAEKYLGIGMYLRHQGHDDEAKSNFIKTVALADEQLANGYGNREELYLFKISALAFCGDDEKVHSVIANALATETDAALIETLNEINQDYDGFKHTILNTFHAFGE